MCATVLPAVMLNESGGQEAGMQHVPAFHAMQGTLQLRSCSSMTRPMLGAMQPPPGMGPKLTHSNSLALHIANIRRAHLSKTGVLAVVNELRYMQMHRLAMAIQDGIHGWHMLMLPTCGEASRQLPSCCRNRRPEPPSGRLPSMRPAWRWRFVSGPCPAPGAPARSPRRLGCS